MQADIQSLMEGELGQSFEASHEAMEKARRLALIIAIAGTLVWIGGSLFLWMGTDMHVDDLTGFVVLFPIAAAFLAYWPLHRVKKRMKTGINSAIAEQFGLTFATKAKPGPEQLAALKYGMFPYHDISEFSDQWEGKLEGHPFKLYEACLSRSRGGLSFSGVVMAMEIGRAFASTTLLQRAGKHDSWMGFGERKDMVKFVDHTLRFVPDFHPAFDERFEVWSDDESEARELITPGLIDHLLEFETAFEGEQLRALFHEGRIIVVLKTRNLFESGSAKAGREAQAVEDVAGQIGALAGLALAFDQRSHA